MVLDARLRWMLGLLGLGLVGVSVALAWQKSDGVTVVGFLGAGTILTVLAAIPVLPSKFGVAGNTLEYPPEHLVDREFIATLEAELGNLFGEIGRRQTEAFMRDHPGEYPPTGGGIGAYEADIESARQLAREARTPAELDRAIDAARQAAREHVHAVRYVIDPPRGIG